MTDAAISAAALEPRPLAPVAAEAAEELLLARGIVKRFRGMPAPVLDSLDLELREGETAWIGGRNGVGKTTLLRVLAGLFAPDAGEVSLYGLDPDRHRSAYHRRVGLLTAGTSGLYARLKVRQHLQYWSAIAFVPAEERAGAVERAVERFELGPLYEKRVDRLSMGQRQRVRLAMTFLHEPYVVLLDEPRNSLDGEAAELLVRELRRTVSEGGCALWCSPSGEATGMDFDDSYELVGGRLSRL